MAYDKTLRKRRLMHNPVLPNSVIPTAYEWGWSSMPIITRILAIGVVLTVVSLTTPFWAYIQNYEMTATFGLWHFCVDNHCSSIHDNLIPGRDIPLWFHMSQVCFTLGCIATTLAMFVIASHHEGTQIRMPRTMCQMMVLMLFAGVLQMFTSLYTFITYFEHTQFIHNGDMNDVWFHGSFFAGIAGALCHMVGGFALFIDEDICRSSQDILLDEEESLKKSWHQPTRYIGHRTIPHVKRLNTTPAVRQPRSSPNIMDELYLAAAAQQVLKQKLS